MKADVEATFANSDSHESVGSIRAGFGGPVSIDLYCERSKVQTVLYPAKPSVQLHR